MSVHPSSNDDASTSNANWGTIVIVLLVVIVGVVVGVITFQPHTEANPVLINQPATQSVPATAPAGTPAPATPTASPSANGASAGTSSP